MGQSIGDGIACINIFKMVVEIDLLRQNRITDICSTNVANQLAFIEALNGLRANIIICRGQGDIDRLRHRQRIATIRVAQVREFRGKADGDIVAFQSVQSIPHRLIFSIGNDRIRSTCNGNGWPDRRIGQRVGPVPFIVGAVPGEGEPAIGMRDNTAILQCGPGRIGSGDSNRLPRNATCCCDRDRQAKRCRRVATVDVGRGQGAGCGGIAGGAIVDAAFFGHRTVIRPVFQLKAVRHRRRVVRALNRDRDILRFRQRLTIPHPHREPLGKGIPVIHCLDIVIALSDRVGPGAVGMNLQGAELASNNVIGLVSIGREEIISERNIARGNIVIRHRAGHRRDTGRGKGEITCQLRRIIAGIIIDHRQAACGCQTLECLIPASADICIPGAALLADQTAVHTVIMCHGGDHRPVIGAGHGNGDGHDNRRPARIGEGEGEGVSHRLVGI